MDQSRSKRARVDPQSAAARTPAYRVRYGRLQAELTRVDLERAAESLLSSILLALDPEDAEVLTIPSAEGMGGADSLAGWIEGSEDLFKVMKSFCSCG